MTTHTYLQPIYGTPNVLNADGTALRVDAQWLVDFDQFDGTLSFDVSYYGKIAATEIAGGIAVWISDVSMDATGTAELVALLELPLAGTVPFLYRRLTGVVGNPGGTKYLIFTSFAGENGEEHAFMSVDLTYHDGVIILSSGGDAPKCGAIKAMMPPTYRLADGDPIKEVLCTIGDSDNHIGGQDT